MDSYEQSRLSSSLLQENQSIFKRFLQYCLRCCIPKSSPPEEPIELKEFVEHKETEAPHEKITIKSDRVIVPVRAASPPLYAYPENISPPKKKKSKKKGLPIISSLVDGYQVLGNGKETVVVTLSRAQVEFNKTTFRSDIKKKPDYVPLKY